MSKLSIPSSTVDELYCSGEGAVVDGFRSVKDMYLDSGRWESHHWMVVEEIETNNFYAIEYSVGLTENQDNSFPWRPSYGDKPATVEAFRVNPKPVVTMVYERAE